MSKPLPRSDVRASRTLLRALGWIGALVACSAPVESSVTRTTLVLEEGGLDLRRLETAIATETGGRVTAIAAGRIALEVPEGSPTELTIPELCPAVIAPGTVTVRARVRVETEPPPFGFDAPYRVEVLPGCREALSGRIHWRSSADRLLATERNGFVVTGRTPPLDPALEEAAFGIVPISAARTGQDLLTMRFEQGGAVIERTVTVRAVSRASGIPSVPTGSTLYLSGGPFTVLEGESDAVALTPEGALTQATFAVPGRFVLAAGERTLSLRVGSHRDTPLDCGRAECHASAAEHAATSPMTSALRGHLSSPERLSCAVPCHSVSEPGLPDGGFAHVAREHGWHAPDAEPDDPLAALPRAMRRLGGVGCTACHGPGAIPEESARWAILRSDVCAVCHDAPPRYGHVAAWRTSAMARADSDPRARSAPCAGCHTTDGFLERIGVRGPSGVPEEVRPLGISCSACHAPHAAHGESLVRSVEVPASLGAVPDTAQPICLPCHAPTSEGVRSAQAVFALGRGAIDPSSGAPLTLDDDAHASLRCTDCHASPGGEALERGAGHAFAIEPARCLRCHETAPSPMPAALADRASRLDRLAAFAHDGAGAAPPAGPGDSVEARLRYDAALLEGDAAAWAHGPRYFTRLIEAMEAAAP